MDQYLAFIIAVMANVVSHIICKWFDSGLNGRR